MSTAGDTARAPRLPGPARCPTDGRGPCLLPPCAPSRGHPSDAHAHLAVAEEEQGSRAHELPGLRVLVLGHVPATEDGGQGPVTPSHQRATPGGHRDTCTLAVTSAPPARTTRAGCGPCGRPTPRGPATHPHKRTHVTWSQLCPGSPDERRTGLHPQGPPASQPRSSPKTRAGLPRLGQREPTSENPGAREGGGTDEPQRQAHRVVPGDEGQRTGRSPRRDPGRQRKRRGDRSRTARRGPGDVAGPRAAGAPSPAGCCRPQDAAACLALAVRGRAVQ